jgi:cation diffusion facilitator family transporter
MERQNRLARINRVLSVTFCLNLLVCLVKIVLGLLTGVLAITADGIHSLGDSLSNIVGFIGIRLARKEPDEKYPYGYDKFEAVATFVIASIISVTFYKVVESGIERILNPRPVSFEPIILILMLLTTAVNAFVVWYEGGAGKRLQSNLLVADASETKGDIFVSLGVIAGVYFIGRLGIPWLDGAITLVIAGFIFKIIMEIFRSTSKILCDAQVVDPKSIKDVVMSIPDVKFCHAIRSRGSEAGFYLDFHLGVDESMQINKAHDEICHKVKARLLDIYPSMKAANIHLEPDNDAGRERKNSAFRQRDKYGLS